MRERTDGQRTNSAEYDRSHLAEVAQRRACTLMKVPVSIAEQQNEVLVQGTFANDGNIETAVRIEIAGSYGGDAFPRTAIHSRGRRERAVPAPGKQRNRPTGTVGDDNIFDVGSGEIA